MLKQGTLFCCIIISLCLCITEDSQGWWFNKSDNERLTEALTSAKPGKVEKGLDHFIKTRNYSAILRIRNHARTMLRQQRNVILRTNRLEPESIRAAFSPWISIDKKATHFFKRTDTRQNGKDSLKTMYHR